MAGVKGLKGNRLEFELSLLVCDWQSLDQYGLNCIVLATLKFELFH